MLPHHGRQPYAAPRPQPPQFDAKREDQWFGFQYFAHCTLKGEVFYSTDSLVVQANISDLKRAIGFDGSVDAAVAIHSCTKLRVR
jgi:hypothetical protein